MTGWKRGRARGVYDASAGRTCQSSSGLDTEGAEKAGGIAAYYLSAPFASVYTAGSPGARGSAMISPKLTSLGSEGRSTATTILSLSTIRNLRAVWTAGRRT